MPKINFDGSKKIYVEKDGVKDDMEKDKLLLEFANYLKDKINPRLTKSQGIDAIEELENIIRDSKNNNQIVNYWA